MGKVVADLQDALVLKLGEQLYEVYRAVEAAGSWGKVGEALDVKFKLTDVFGELNEFDFFIEPVVKPAVLATAPAPGPLFQVGQSTAGETF